MKVLLYFEGEKMISTSGIGRALKHQEAACASCGIETTTNPDEPVDLVHINTVGPGSLGVIAKARKEGIPVIYHAHSTEEDFRNSFVFSNAVAPAFKQHLIKMYSMADYLLTPTPYSKKLLEGYGITVPIEDISNGIDIKRFEVNAEKVKAYRKYFSLNEDDKVVLSVGLYFERKGILDFIEVAKRLPEYKFIWFGYTPLYSIPKQIRQIIDDHPRNVYFPGYVKGPIIEGAYLDADCFFFASHEETEGIVVLEALASGQNIVVRDIGVFDPWLKHARNCYKGNSIDEFEELVRGVVEKTLPDVSEQGRKTAEERSIERVGQKLKKIYEHVIQQQESSDEKIS